MNISMDGIMNKKYFISSSILLVLLGSIASFFFVGTGVAAGREIYVDCAGHLIRDGTAENPYKTITEALSQANDGDSIYVFGGRYNETLTIDKRVTIIGSISNGNSVIDSRTYHKYTIEISANYVTLEGFNISDEYNLVSDIRGALIHVVTDNVIIQQNNISHCQNGWGIYLDNSGGHVIGGNHINWTKSGIYLSSSNTNDFINNVISNCTTAGVEMYSSSNNRFYRNCMNTSRYGIYASTCNNINITNNTINRNLLHGIALYRGNNAVIQLNHIRKSAVEGIHLNAQSSNVSLNHFIDNQVGCNLDQSNGVVWNNIFENSIGTGLLANVGSKNNIISHNHFNGNEPNAHEKGLNVWDYNYWDTYNEVDRDHDGVGDIPYSVPGGAIDHYPLGVFLSPPNKPTDPQPIDDKDNVGLRVTLGVKVTDPNRDLMRVYFYDASDDRLLGYVTNIYSGKRANYTFTLPFDKTFAWYAIANDSKQENRSDIWFFTTKARPPTNKKPVANTGGPYVSGIDLPITFDASASSDPDGTITFYRWNFGDGTSQILSRSPVHRYSNPGTYIVTLTVVDNDGRSTTANTTATILSNFNQKPVAVIEAPYSGTTGKSISFNGSSSYDPDGTIVEYRWDFENDSIPDTEWSTSPGITHSYSTVSNYTVKLEVKDNSGNIGFTTKLIVVTLPKKTPGFELPLLLIVISFGVFVKQWRRKR